MANREDIADRKLTLRLFAIIAAAVAVAGVVLFFLGGPLVDRHLEPGLGLKSSALISFGATLAVVAIMALVAGDGLLGEIQFMLAGFAGFFVIFWLLIAWIF